MKRQWFYILFIFPVFSSCLESPVMTTGIVNGKEKPTVVTGTAAPCTSDGVLFFQGGITSEGKSKIIEKGFYWSTISHDPGSSDNVVIVSDANSDFSYEIKGASGDTTYYWRAFARNSYGYDYGVVRSYQTPAIWIAKLNLPTDSRGMGAVFALNNSLFMTCGIKNWGQVPVEDTWEYNITNNFWNQSDSISFPGNQRRYPVVFTIGNLAFVGTGQDFSAIARKDFYQFSANSKKWTEIATPDDLEARYEAVAFSLNGNGYLVGGLSSDRQELNDVWQYTYSGTGGSWEKMNNFPVNFYAGISISDNSRAFAGFSDVTESARTLWEYDKETDSWDEFATLPDEVTTKIYSGVIVQNAIYIVDGNNTIWTLNMSDKTWKKKADLSPEFLNENKEGGFQNLLITGNSNSIYVGLGFTSYLYEYRPLWDN